MVSLCFFLKQKSAFEMRISDWSSDVFSSDLFEIGVARHAIGHELDAYTLEHLQLRIRSPLRWRTRIMRGDQQQALVTAQVVDRLDAQFVGSHRGAITQVSDRKSTRLNSSH